jgi:hypothetical protein
MSRLFTLTLQWRIKCCFEKLLAKSIHTWRQFMELFYSVHEDYNYNDLRLEVKNLHRHEGEVVDELFYIFMLN